MPKHTSNTAAPSQRMLRVAEEVRHALSAVFTRGDLHDPELADARVTVTEVRASPDLRHMTVFVSRLGATADKALLTLLRENQPELRKQVARSVRLKFAPELHFQADTAIDYAMHIDSLMRRPEVARDLGPRAEPVPDKQDDDQT
ncbi:30S ribosome-binding factor RbfA [Roseomonas harenae]|uniref:30S ribosome-binding factor RbfA n=1 Tax=Muricoccus harenae TaxID=2692566 RepID=UPI0013319210|nr:30S ribosome-binding factor RbfA [Roseomonas harenae]